MALVSPKRVLDLVKVRCAIFGTVFNPKNERLGNKVLRQKLRGSALASYYPRRVVTFKDLKNLYPGFELYDEKEEDRLEHIQLLKARGKGAPKKLSAPAEAKRGAKKKK